MSKPDDIPEDVWETAQMEAMKYVEWLTPFPTDYDAEHVLAVSFSRAILSERERWIAIASPLLTALHINGWPVSEAAEPALMSGGSVEARVLHDAAKAFSKAIRSQS